MYFTEYLLISWTSQPRISPMHRYKNITLKVPCRNKSYFIPGTTQLSIELYYKVFKKSNFTLPLSKSVTSHELNLQKVKYTKCKKKRKNLTKYPNQRVASSFHQIQFVKFGEWNATEEEIAEAEVALIKINHHFVITFHRRRLNLGASSVGFTASWSWPV